MKLGSLFDGSGGFPLAGTLCGIYPAWASEIEPYPVAVTKKHFPDMVHLGDVTKISGAEIEPVDLVTFGSPCQDLSVAGKRKGLKHEANGDEETTRSGLFMEAVRIIKEMREATNGMYPAFALWENVPGALSSQGGEDFCVVLEELARIADEAVSVPRPKKWLNAGCIMGDGWSIAWRILDAQYWGVPQRRRRIYLVADFRGQRAGEILFKREGLRGYFETGRTPWKRFAVDAQRNSGADDCIPINTMIATRSNKLGRGTGLGIGRNGDKQFTISAAHSHAICYGICSYESNSMKSNNPNSGIYEATTSRTLDLNGGNPACNQGGIAVLSIENHPSDSRVVIKDDGIVQTHTSAMGTGGGNCPMVMHSVGFEQRDYSSFGETGKSATLKAMGGTLGGGSESLVVKKTVRPIVRRLTPTECARLQGFPDRWGDVSPEDKKLHSDSAEYKMWGNGIALPTALYVMQGIAEVMC